ncbi:MAG: DNA polymerase III subunit delta [Gemmatimonadales bacterium]
MPALDYDTFRRSVKKGEILPAYYFHGDEDLLKDDAIRQVLEVAVDPSSCDFNLDRRRAADLSADDFWSLTLTPPMLAERRAIVITEIESIQQRRQKSQALRAALLKYLGSPSPQSVLVLVQSSGEKNDPEVARAVTTVAFDPLAPDRLRRWIRHRAEQEGLEIDEDGARHLHEAVGDDLPQLAAEISKLRTAVTGRVATASDVSDMVGVRRGETAYDFVDAVTARRFAAAADMIAHLLEGPGNSGVRLVTALGTALTGLALARSLLDQGTPRASVARQLGGAIGTARPMGLRGWSEEAERWARDAMHWSAAELERALAELLRADRRLKSAALGGEPEILTGTVLAMAGAAAAAA